MRKLPAYFPHRRCNLTQSVDMDLVLKAKQSRRFTQALVIATPHPTHTSSSATTKGNTQPPNQPTNLPISVCQSPHCTDPVPWTSQPRRLTSGEAGRRSRLHCHPVPAPQTGIPFHSIPRNTTPVAWGHVSCPFSTNQDQAPTRNWEGGRGYLKCTKPASSHESFVTRKPIHQALDGSREIVPQARHSSSTQPQQCPCFMKALLDTCVRCTIDCSDPLQRIPLCKEVDKERSVSLNPKSIAQDNSSTR